MICLHTIFHMSNTNGFHRHQIHFTNSPYCFRAMKVLQISKIYYNKIENTTLSGSNTSSHHKIPHDNRVHVLYL
jgi:hypothetical protein